MTDTPGTGAGWSDPAPNPHKCALPEQREIDNQADGRIFTCTCAKTWEVRSIHYDPWDHEPGDPRKGLFAVILP